MIISIMIKAIIIVVIIEVLSTANIYVWHMNLDIKE